MSYTVVTPNGTVLFEGCKTDALRFASEHFEGKGEAIQRVVSSRYDYIFSISGQYTDLDVVRGTRVNVVI
tara:strand:- start:482 stop:691 length:210 start_codon:yes stop_codon:yes gene_type:complete